MDEEIVLFQDASHSVGSMVEFCLHLQPRIGPDLVILHCLPCPQRGVGRAELRAKGEGGGYREMAEEDNQEPTCIFSPPGCAPDTSF